jgi:cyclophilin family peptidyl-prolyl cis-trans isomerase
LTHFLLGFVIQFGLAAEPEETAKWDHPIVDDTYNVQSNTLGTLSFAMAGPGTRTSQIFVNLADNTNLDSQGFTPFARTISGFSVWHEIYNPTKESGGASQGKLTREGNKWILAEFPDIDLILSTSYEIIENGDDTNDVPVPATTNEAGLDTPVATESRNLQLALCALEVTVLLFLIKFY